ncbi:MAG: UDP-3-O-(3-hydroxymyristoyl)glucosamine N-acyltransferase [Gammaproteobacteria bacterium]|nr:UDP-3-O-(3-hydroxymyristoyl)glucosamine N-acyltransferase [Gammaproteobacteria bacterium]NNL06847.1 UDP-3-O-(3-hydroxymyristoyl)glucosamine N-acyltransferase [Gammaproteobacteria bacterium]
MPYTLFELADHTGARLSGSGDVTIDKVADITSGEKGSIVFASNERYRKHLKTTAASAVIIPEEISQDCEKPALVTENPRLAFSRIALLLNPLPVVEPWISPHAVIAEDADIDPSARIEACVVIQSGVTIGPGTWISAGCVLEQNVRIGANTRLFANVTIGEGCRLGDNNILHSGVVIGADGFGFLWDRDAYMKVPQLGSVQIGNDVEIGANTSIDRGAIGDTVIENGVKIDNQIQLGHNDHVGEHTTMSGHCGIAGSVKIGRKCVIGGGVGIGDNLEITDNVVLAGRSNVANSIKAPGMYASVIPAVEVSKWRRILARIKQLDELAKRVKALERKQ